MMATTTETVERGGAPALREARREDVQAACRYAVRHTRRWLDPERVLESAVNLVAGYAMSELHRLGLDATPAAILEHARAAIAEA